MTNTTAAIIGLALFGGLIIGACLIGYTIMLAGELIASRRDDPDLKDHPHA